MDGFRRASRIVLVAATAAALCYGAWLLLSPYDSGLYTAYTSLALALLSLPAAAAGFGIAASRDFAPELRRAWGFIALASLSVALADGLWFYFSEILGVEPFPSIADLFYLLTYPLLLIGIQALPHAPAGRAQRMLFNVDVAIVVLACGLFLWHFALADLAAQGAGGLAGLVSLAYPVVDLVILAGLVTLLQQEVRGVGRGVLMLFAASIALVIAADILFAAGQTGQGAFVPAAANILWLAARWAVLAAAVWQINRPQDAAGPAGQFRPLLRANLAYAAAPAGMALAFWALSSLFESDLRLYGTVVGALGVTLLVLLRQFFVLQDNRRLHKEVEQLAVTDALTGLANRRHFDEALRREVARAHRYRRPLALLMIDVDDFKNYNDRLGHLQGDRLLQSIARLLKARVRASDLPARLGGDEFVVILPEAGAQTAQEAAEKLRRDLRQAAGLEEPVRLSIGIAVLAEDMQAEALLELADRAMYLDKAGRGSGRAAAA